MYFRFIQSPFVFDLYFENEMLVLEINKSFLDLNLIPYGRIKWLEEDYKIPLGEYKQDKESFGFGDVFTKIKEDDESVYFGADDFLNPEIIAFSLYIFFTSADVICRSRNGEYKIQSKKFQEFWIQTIAQRGMDGFNLMGICSNECLEKILNFGSEQEKQIKDTMLFAYKSWKGLNPEYEHYSVGLYDNFIQINESGGKGTWITIGSRDRVGEINGHNIDSSIEQIILLCAFAQIRAMIK